MDQFRKAIRSTESERIHRRKAYDFSILIDGVG
jgi:hypothetical protein